MNNDKCGIYQIMCVVSGKSYVGSSCVIYRRWSQHRARLRLGKHTSPRLQQAWNKHGEDKFVFSVLEECGRDDLFKREQHWIDLKKRDYNSMQIVRVITPEMRSKMNATMAAIAESRTHCPHGHEYTPENVYFGKKKGDKRCRTCNNERVARRIAAETPEQTQKRLAQCMANYYAKHAEKRAKANDYAKRNREAKRAYDIAYRPIKNARRREVAAQMRAQKWRME